MPGLMDIQKSLNPFGKKFWGRNIIKKAPEFLFGSEQEFQPFNKGSLSFLENLLQGGGLEGNPLFGGASKFLQSLYAGEPGAFENFERPFKEQFEQQTVPGLAERFGRMGTGAGGTNSSAFYNSLAQAGRGLSGDLATLRSGLQMQGLPQALQYSQSPIINALQAAGLIPSQYYEIPGQEGLVQGTIKAFAHGAGQGAGGGF